MFTVLTFWLSLEFDDTYRKQVPKQFSAKTCKEFVNIESSLLLLDIFDILTEAIKFYKLYCLISKRTDV